ncbi:histidinol-phosphatase HisJ [Priestia abyssalis]|uniref:histidinol-phosphatase HisJ n=1 Tax=Priestia abyssalis TaxID=1221450 RepID=UPI0009957717|nr:histidinol-phosphatase HisJ [Priestia abyssalis]
MKIDGHIHTPFCPHGSKDSLDQYVEQAIQLGFEQISFTEHAPLPRGFTDPTPFKDSAITLQEMERYLLEIRGVKERFRKDLNIQVGLEVDYIEGFEEETRKFLDEYGPHLDDSILSVHFLKKDLTYYCLDYSDDVFGQMIECFSSVGNVYEAYFDTVLSSIESDLGKYKPKRIGHITLVHKFQRRFPCSEDFKAPMIHILERISDLNLQLDYNAAGLFKPLCQETYPPQWVVEEAKKKKIPLIYGSDAHCAKDLGQGFPTIFKG